MVQLIPLEMKHLHVLTKWNYDPDITSFFTARPALDMEQQTKWLQHTIADVRKQKFMLLDTESNTLVGVISLMKINTENQEAEYGITIGEKAFWGSGIAAQASEQLFRYSATELHLKRLYLRVFDSNKRAISFFAKLGFKHYIEPNNTAQSDGIKWYFMELSLPYQTQSDSK